MNPEHGNRKTKKARWTFLVYYLEIQKQSKFKLRLDIESSIRKRGSVIKAIGTQILQTDRLILRRFVESDAEAMFQNWASSAENLTYVTWDPHSNVEITRNSI